MKIQPVIYISMAIVAGLCLGLAAPGIGLWFTAWFALAPLLFIVRTDKSLPRSLLYGFLFGLAYNCVYLQWYLGLAPLDWLGFNAWQGQLLAVAALLINSIHQALLIAIFAFVYRLLLNSVLNTPWFARPQNAGLIQMLVVPILWVIATNKLGNAHNLTGVPWSMLEYTQYKQIYIIQIADLIGGIGISFLIVMVNALIAQIAFCIFHSLQSEPAAISASEPSIIPKPAAATPTGAPIASPPATPDAAPHLFLNATIQAENNPFADVCQKIAYQNQPGLTVCLLLFISTIAYGYFRLDNQGNETVSILQPNINIEMEKTKRKYSLPELLNHQFNLARQCPPGLCVWTEGSVPITLSQDIQTKSVLADFAKSKKLSFIIGTIDNDTNGNFYNAACAITDSGQISEHAYHKRYLVPFGEYTPAFVRNFPEWILRLTNTPAGGGYASGEKPALLNVNNKLIAPLICFEVISPELAAQSVRAGGQLLVNLNDLAWFHQSIIGEQMIAAAVLRAVENRRYFIFAANTGPSAIIKSNGEINSYLGQNKAAVLSSKFYYSSQLSFFTRYFIF